jgi:hypothetical protein
MVQSRFLARNRRQYLSSLYTHRKFALARRAYGRH